MTILFQILVFGFWWNVTSVQGCAKPLASQVHFIPYEPETYFTGEAIPIDRVRPFVRKISDYATIHYYGGNGEFGSAKEYFSQGVTLARHSQADAQSYSTLAGNHLVTIKYVPSTNRMVAVIREIHGEGSLSPGRILFYWYAKPTPLGYSDGPTLFRALTEGKLLSFGIQEPLDMSRFHGSHGMLAREFALIAVTNPLVLCINNNDRKILYAPSLGHFLIARKNEEGRWVAWSYRLSRPMKDGVPAFDHFMSYLPRPSQG